MRNNAFYQWTDPSTPARVGPGRRFVIQEWQRGVLFKDGRLDTVLGPGPYRRFQRGFALRRVDVRPWVLPVPMQEIPTADGLTVKVSVVGRARVVDPAAFVTASQDAHAALYLNAQIATREVIAATTVEQLVASRQELGDALTGAVRGLDELGVALERLELKDVIFSSELKKAQAEVIVARAQGLAALERARGETAALRNLANAAALLKDNPALLQLRLVQQLAATTGHTVVIGQAPLGACPSTAPRPAWWFDRFASSPRWRAVRESSGCSLSGGAPMRRWQLCLALSLLASVLYAPAADAALSAQEGPGAMVSGLLSDAADNPVAGAVELFAWPTGRPVEVGRALQLLPVGHDRVDKDGLFSITGELTPDLAELARLNGGYVNFVLQAVAAGVLEETHFFCYVGDTPVSAQEAGTAPRPVEWRASPEERAEPLRIRLQDAPEESAGDRPIRPMQGGCWGLTLVESRPSETVIGELRAPDDTESAMFTYGKRSDSEIGVAGKAANGPWSMSGSYKIANSQEAAITQRALSGEHLLVRSRFIYERYEYKCPSGKRERVVPARWMGDVQAQPTAVRGCLRTIEENRGYYGSNGGFTRAKEKAARWTGAVEVFGASLTAQSGYSKYVWSDWRFGRGSHHVLCGDDGPPWEAGHIFAGPSL